MTTAFTLACGFCLVVSCESTRNLDPDGFKKWFRDVDNGWCATSDTKDFSFYLQCEPAEIKALQTLDKNSFNQSSHMLEMEDYNELEYYTFTIKSAQGSPVLTHISEGQDDYMEKQLYLTTEIQADFLLLTPSDTLLPVLCHAEPTYESTNTTLLDIAFVKSTKGKRKFIYTDRLLGIDPQIFDLDTSEKPNLKFN